MRSKTLQFFFSLLVLTVWAGYSWYNGPSQSTIDKKFEFIEVEREGIAHIIKISQRLLINDTRVDKLLFLTMYDSLIIAYYKPYLQTAIDTISYIDLEVKKSMIDGVIENMPQDTTFLGRKFKISKELIFNKTFVFKTNDKAPYLKLSLNAFSDLNLKYEGGAPQDFQKYLEITDRVSMLLSNSNNVQAKIVRSNNTTKLEPIYELLGEGGEILMTSKSDYERLHSEYVGDYEYIDTEFVVWHDTYVFKSRAIFISIFVLIAFIILLNSKRDK